MESTFSKIGKISIPQSLAQYVEANEDRLVIEQTSFDAVNGYAQGVGTKVKIQRFYEYCPICGYHSLKNPHQKRLPMERRHRYERGYETVFYWDDYSRRSSLEETFDMFIKREDKWNTKSKLPNASETPSLTP